MSTPDWSALPGTALALISARLASSSVLNQIRFRSVCSSWRAAAADATIQLLLSCLVVRRKPIAGRDTVFAFYGFNGSLLSPPIAEFSDPDDLALRPCCSCHGWLTLLPNPHCVVLWNPVTGARFVLPPISGIFDKIVLSSSDPAASDVLLTHCYGNKLFVRRPGDQLWSSIRKPPDLTGYHDVGLVFFRGMFYLAAGHRVYACSPGPPVRVERVLPTTPPVEDSMSDSMSDEMKWFSEQMIRETYLLESNGELLLINVYVETNKCSATVFQLVWIGHQVKLLQLRDLGDIAVFVSSGSSFCLSTSKFPRLKRNCIYRAVDQEKHIMVIHLEDFRNELILDLFEESRWNGELHSWITPNFM